jgi:L-aminopeptidase/D-esterase-like protein
MIGPVDTGPRGLTDVTGFRVGHYTDLESATGCTVVIAPDEGAIGGVDVRGPAAGTIGTDTLRPGRVIEHANAILLTGGSAFGLAATFGVMRFLEEREIGFAFRTTRIPIVAGAVVFDLLLGSAVRPDAAAGYAACEAASDGPVIEGSVGAGTGATVGKFLGAEQAMKGGLGSAAAAIAGGATVGTLAVVNAVGDVVDPDSGEIVAGARRPDGPGWLDSGRALRGALDRSVFALASTTLAVVATDAALTKEQACAVAMMAHDGIARTTRPAHTMFDGDTVFVLATGRAGRTDLTAIGHVAAELIAEAILRGVHAAEGLGGVPSVRELAQSSN